MGWEFAGNGIKCLDLLLEKYCKNLFYLMDGFWEAIADVDIDWLSKIRTHLDKIRKEQAKSKWKKLTSLPRNSHLKRTVFDKEWCKI